MTLKHCLLPLLFRSVLVLWLCYGSSMAAQGSPLDAATVARLEQALTTAMARYLADVHSGRVDPQKIRHNFSPPEREPFDAAAHLQAALAAGRLGDAALEAAPRLPIYASLREALADLHQAALSLNAGGVGFYPRDQFVHLDTGRVRNW